MSSLVRRVGLASALALGLALPAAAQGATPFLSGSVKYNKKYSVTVSGSASTQSKSASVGLFRSSRGSSQSHTLSSSKNVTYTAAQDLSKATLKATFGSRGRVSMKFRATGSTRKSLPSGCKGTPSQSRRGVLSGTLRGSLGGKLKVVKKSISAALFKAGNFTCGGTTTTRKSVSLSASVSSRSKSFFVSFSKGSKGSVFQSASYSETNAAAGYSLSHFISALAPRSTLTYAKSLVSATGHGAGPFLGGTLSFISSGQPTGSFVSGVVTGTFVAKFDTGRKKLPRGATGSLSRF